MGSRPRAGPQVAVRAAPRRAATGTGGHESGRLRRGRPTCATRPSTSSGRQDGAESDGQIRGSCRRSSVRVWGRAGGSLTLLGLPYRNRLPTARRTTLNCSTGRPIHEPSGGGSRQVARRIESNRIASLPAARMRARSTSERSRGIATSYKLNLSEALARQRLPLVVWRPATSAPRSRSNPNIPSRGVR